MCENCGIDHPTIEDIAGDLVMLNNASEWAMSIGSTRGEGSDAPNGYAVERFCSATIERYMDDMMQRQLADGTPFREAMHTFSWAMMSLGFSIGVKTSTHWIKENPEHFEEQTPETTPEEAAAYVAAGKRREEERDKLMEAVSSALGDPEKIASALRDAGIPIPDGAEIKMVQMPDGGVALAPAQANEEEGNGGRIELPGTGQYL